MVLELFPPDALGHIPKPHLARRRQDTRPESLLSFPLKRNIASHHTRYSCYTPKYNSYSIYFFLKKKQYYSVYPVSPTYSKIDDVRLPLKDGANMTGLQVVVHFQLLPLALALALMNLEPAYRPPPSSTWAGSCRTSWAAFRSLRSRRRHLAG